MPKLRQFSRFSPVLALGVLLAFGAQAESGPLPSWNNGAAKQAIERLEDLGASEERS